MAAMQNPSIGVPDPETSVHRRFTIESIKAVRSRIAAFPSPEASKSDRIFADSSAYTSCGEEMRFSSSIADQSNLLKYLRRHSLKRRIHSDRSRCLLSL